MGKFQNFSILFCTEGGILPYFLVCFRYMGIGLSAHGVNLNRLPGTVFPLN